MSEEYDAALEILASLGDTNALKAKLDEFIKRKQAAETAEASLKQREIEYENTKTSIDSYVNQRKGALNEAQIAHDRAAAEAGARIELSGKQAQRFEDWEKDLQKREVELGKQSTALVQRDEELAQLANALTIKQKELMVRQADLNNKHKRLQAAME